jgi:CMP-N-acetylneuraminic acid synthetase
VVKRIAIIPARGGSKRIPRKNIIDFCGKPMLAWTIEAAIKSGAFDHVIVSTEDEEIAGVARAHGAEVPFLRQSHHDDIATVSEATLAALDQAHAHFGTAFETVVQLMPNCPLRSAGDITAALNAFNSEHRTFQLSCVRFGWMNPWWALKLDAEGRSEPLFPDALKSRSQDLPPLFTPTGAIWIARADALRQSRSFYGPDHRFHSLSWISGIDIDDEDDLALAKAAYRLKPNAPQGA